MLDINTVLGVTKVKSNSKGQSKQVDVHWHLSTVLLCSWRYQVVLHCLCEVKNNFINFFFDEFWFSFNDATFGVLALGWRRFDIFSTFTGRRGSLGLETSQRIVLEFLSVLVNKHIFKLVKVLLINFDTLVSELVPSNKPALLHDIYCFFSLVKIIHKFGKVTEELCVLCIVLEVFLRVKS